jgi:hypothetical protein
VRSCLYLVPDAIPVSCATRLHILVPGGLIIQSLAICTVTYGEISYRPRSRGAQCSFHHPRIGDVELEGTDNRWVSIHPYTKYLWFPTKCDPGIYLASMHVDQEDEGFRTGSKEGFWNPFSLENTLLVVQRTFVTATACEGAKTDAFCNTD